MIYYPQDLHEKIGLVQLSSIFNIDISFIAAHQVTSKLST